MNAFVIDAFEYSRLKESREGDVAVSDLLRLSDELADASGSIHWSLQGGAATIGHPQLNLAVAGRVNLKCQRCLAPLAFDIGSESILVLAKDEAQADEIDGLLEDDAIDVIVGHKALNVVELIEDEALLAMPLSPKHEVCPVQVGINGLSSGDRVSPFAVLKDVKQ